MANRARYAQVAKETLEVLSRGMYELAGRRISIAAALEAAVHGTVFFDAADAFPRAPPTDVAVVVEVTNETTMQAGRRLHDELVAARGDEAPQALMLLNFASAKNPGGGFDSGARAQEESLARSSGLYSCLKEKFDDFYTPHRQDPQDGIYSDAMLYSPAVPFFRDDEGRFCDTWTAGVLTAAAPNAGVASRSRSQWEISDAVRQRCGRVLQAAAAQGHTHLVLGAFGCGVFRNDPAEVAEAFHHWLFGPPMLSQAFARIVFAVPVGKDGNWRPFAHRFDPSLFQDQGEPMPVDAAPAAEGGDSSTGRDGSGRGRWRKGKRRS